MTATLTPAPVLPPQASSGRTDSSTGLRETAWIASGAKADEYAGLPVSTPHDLKIRFAARSALLIAVFTSSRPVQ